MFASAVCVLSYVLGIIQASNYEVVYQWNQLDYEYLSESQRQYDINTGRFVPGNNAIAGIKVYEDKVFLTVPRWKDGVPATLNVLSRSSLQGQRSPKLVPFPSWDMQEVGNCQKLQYVQSMEIDAAGRMWIIDVGRVNTFTKPVAKCAAKLMVYDLKKDQVIRVYEFPEEVAPKATNFLNDIVVDCTSDSIDECYAYITDAKEAAIVVYQYAGNTAWRFQHPSMEADVNALQFNILGQSRKVNTSIDGISLSPLSTNRTLFYCPLTSFDLYSVDTHVLKNPNGNLEDHVRLLGNKSSQSDGLAMSNTGIMYYALLGDNAVYTWNISEPFTHDNQRLLVQSDQDLQWVDTFAFDDEGYLWFVSNKLNTFFSAFDKDSSNFRVVRVLVESASYLEPVANVSVVGQEGSLLQSSHGLTYNSTVYAHAFPHGDNASSPSPTESPLPQVSQRPIKQHTNSTAVSIHIWNTGVVSALLMVHLVR